MNLWDERFHALVARNLLRHPLMPTLYDDPVLAMDYNRWDRAVIWLHKQPFFLWQISLCYKIFGVSEFTTRLPSVILGSLLVPVSYRTGKLLLNQDAGYFCALLFATSWYLIGLISGRIMVDHNDVSFLFYVSASIWAWVEYLYSRERKWIILAGMFSGVAVLCKWLAGLAVYSGWFVYAIINYIMEKKSTGRNPGVFGPVAAALMITAIVVLPWQLLILHWYPAEAFTEYKENLRHLTTVVEGHGGSGWYYLNNFILLYGLAAIIVLPFAVYSAMRKVRPRSMAFSFFTIPLIVYVFYTISRTKMSSYPFAITLAVFIAFGALYSGLIGFLKRTGITLPVKRGLIVILLSLIGLSNMKFFMVQKNDSPGGSCPECSAICNRNKDIFTSLKMTLPSNSVLFNLKGRTYVDCMFYSGMTAYGFIPTLDQYRRLKEKERTIVVFTGSVQDIPEYLRQDPSVVIRNDVVGSCE